MAKLIIRTGAQMGMEFPADQAVVRLGRGSGNDVILQDTQASRNHAEIMQQGGQVFIRDLGSTNGTFVNDERVIGAQPLRPGDRVRIGDTIMAYEGGFAAPAPAAGAPTAAADWEAQLWEDRAPAGSAGRKQNTLLWVLGGAAVVLLIGLAVVVALLLKKPAEGTPVAGETAVLPTAAAPTSAIVLAPTATPTPEATSVQAPPTDTPLVELPTVELVDTVEVQATAPTVKPPPMPSGMPTGMPGGIPTGMPTGMPVGPESLEQLPALITQAFPGVPQDQLPQAIAQQMQTMSPEELQGMVGALFPGVSMDQLPAVVAASFPGMSQAEIEGLLAMAFPGQNFQMPGSTELGAPMGGKMALGIYDKTRNAYDLYLADQAMAQPRLLVENATDPSFSPDGKYIVYHSSSPEKIGLRIMKVDGSGDQTLTTIASDRNPRFSPDGTRILFSNIDNNTLVVINRDGSDRREIGQGKYPDWSPDGSRIVYQGCVGGGKCGLIVANADGSNPAQITTDANDAMPRWRYGNIAFMSSRDGNFEIYVINPDGTWLRRITTNAATDIMPVWDPDGVRLAFRSDRDGSRAVYTTSGIGGGDFKRFGAEFGADWMLAGMDWGK
jgi:hypothetical protein